MKRATLFFLIVLGACRPDSTSTEPEGTGETEAGGEASAQAGAEGPTGETSAGEAEAEAVAADTDGETPVAATGEPTNLYWGDTHLHTALSPDAYLLQNRSAMPDTAYRWAKGLPVVHPYTQARVQIGTPLDFLIVTDHAELSSVPLRLFTGDEALTSTPTGQRIMELVNAGQEVAAFGVLIAAINRPTAESSQVVWRDFNGEDIRRSAWSTIIEAAEQHNQPGVFTSFIGWEWSSTPSGANLHRVVFFPEGGDVARQFLPFTAIESVRPEDLWAFLDETAESSGARFVAIPHNANISQGLMFQETDSDGRPITADYANTRMRWEQLIEITQIKGDSETHPDLSPTDEFADFETFQHVIAAGDDAVDADELGVVPGDYVRSGLRMGLSIAAGIGVNPFQLGFIGSTDSHTGLSSAEEDNFQGKFAIDGSPEGLFVEVMPGATGIDMSASGLAAVWATENTRESLYEAFRRREVYATTGPRIRLRVFGGWEFEASHAEAVNLAEVGYANGVPMGGELSQPPDGSAPSLLIHAARDPVGANLDRVQVIKCWIDAEGETHEQIVDVALSDGRAVAANGAVPPVGNTVDLATARYTNDIGASQLAAVWTDDAFDPAQRAFYYVRVIQIPTPRNSLYDSVAMSIDHPEGHPPTIQERAYSSPIWYTP